MIWEPQKTLILWQNNSKSRSSYLSRAFCPITQSLSADGAHLTAEEMNLPIREPSSCVTRSSSYQTTFSTVNKCQNLQANMKEKSQKCCGWNHNSHWASILIDPHHDNRTAAMIPSTAHPGPPACSGSKASKFMIQETAARQNNPSSITSFFWSFQLY